MKRLLSIILNFFRSKPKPAPQGDGFIDSESNEFKPKWGFIVPHTKRSPGAWSKEKRVSEYQYGLNMVKGMLFPWATRDTGGVFGAAKKLKSKGINATIEPHKNAFNGKAHGFELLVMKGDKLSASYARLIAEAFQDRYPNRRLRNDKGIKWLEKGDRGYNNLKAAKDAGIDIVILSETFFIDNPKEWIDNKVMAKFWSETLK